MQNNFKPFSNNNSDAEIFSEINSTQSGAINFHNSNQPEGINFHNSSEPPALQIVRELGLKQADLADAAHVSAVAAHGWVRGKFKPDATSRNLIHARWPRLTPETWGPLPRADSEAAHFLAPPVSAPAIDLDAPGAALALIIQSHRQATADRIFARENNAPFDVILQAESTERRCTMALAKLKGELNPTEHQRVVRSAAWRALRGIVLEALADNPEMHNKVAAALEAIEA